jgi:carbonic anhydrase
VTISKLQDGHRRFKDYFSDNKEMFFRLAEEGQTPHVLWIGCSDSRVIPELITSAQPGELYVMRNVANVVPPFGTVNDALGAVIEHAVLHLPIRDIVICGHTECGGIKALGHDISMMHEPHLARWIEFARPALAQIQASGIAEEKHHLETVKANVLLQRQNLLTYDCVRDAIKAGKLSVHAWLYDIWTGDLLQYDDKSGQWRALSEIVNVS